MLDENGAATTDGLYITSAGFGKIAIGVVRKGDSTYWHYDTVNWQESIRVVFSVIKQMFRRLDINDE